VTTPTAATAIVGLDRAGLTSRRDPVLYRRALAMWPRLDRRALGRCDHDPRRVAILVSRRTSLPVDAIVSLLTTPQVSADEAATWFG
jgi:hypothetical protein